MVNWYYVVGSDRVGPVSEAALQVLFLNGEINDDTYIWKKGFANWERLKDVTEIKFELKIDTVEEETINLPEPTLERVQEKIEKVKNIEKNDLAENTREISLAEFKVDKKESPDFKFSFDWDRDGKKDDIFFIKIGKDRFNVEHDIFGPYSLVEINEALKGKRMNLHTLVYSAGMSSWTKLEDTPINNDYNGISISEISLDEVPLVMVFESSPLPLITLVKKAGVKDAVLLGAGPFVEFQNKTVLVSLYIGSELKVKNIQVMVKNYDKKNQTIECQFIDLNSDAKKIMLNHAV